VVALSDVIDSARNLASLVRIPPSLGTGKSASGKLYEAWMMIELAVTVSALDPHWRVEWRDGATAFSRVTPSLAVFRGAPGSIGNNTRGQPGFVYLQRKDGRSFELHNSLQFRGASHCLHEMDISVIQASYGRYLRAHSLGVPDGLPEMALELKHYVKSSFSIGLARAMILGVMDLSLVDSTPFPPTIHYIAPGGGHYRGNIDHILYRAVTSAKLIGTSGSLANFYNSDVLANFDANPSHRSGTLPDMNKLARTLLRYLR
jgi:hypothetical protein